MVIVLAAAGTTVINLWGHTVVRILGALLFVLTQAVIIVVYVYRRWIHPGRP